MKSSKPRFILLSFLSLTSYFVSYWPLMIRDFPVVEEGKIRYYSTFRWATPRQREDGELDFGQGSASIFNLFYLPADYIYYYLNRNSFLVKSKNDPLFRHMY